MNESQRMFVYTDPEALHSVGFSVDDEYDFPLALIRFCDGESTVMMTFDSQEELDNFKYIMHCFFEAAEHLFKISEGNEQ